MLEITATQLDAWVSGLMLPLARLLGLVSTAPLFSNRAISARIRLVVGLAIGLAVLPVVPPTPPVAASSWLLLTELAKQMLIGMTIGFMMRLFFAAVDIAGEMIGLQMGLSFAVFFNPQTGGQSSVVAEFLNLLSLLIFLALDGHLLLISVLVKTFEWIPIGHAINADALLLIPRYAAVMFVSGILLALPLIATLLITNVSLGVLTRAAPQLNLFAVGFPVTLTVGLIVLLISLSYLAPMLQRLFEHGFQAIDEMLRVMA